MTDERTDNHSIDRVTTAEELNEAFNKGLIELYQAVFAVPPYEEGMELGEKILTSKRFLAG